VARTKSNNDSDKGKQKSDTQSAFDKAKQAITKEYGTDTLIKPLSEVLPVSYISTGIFTIDLALLGGITDGNYNLLYGNKNVGKTSVSILAGRNGLIKYPDSKLLYVRTEPHFDKSYVEQLFGDVSGRVHVLEDFLTIEACTDIIEELLLTGEFSFVIFDSLAFFDTEDRDEKSAFDEEKMAQKAKKVGRLISTITMCGMKLRKAGFKRPTILLINQFIASMSQYGSPNALPAGKRPQQVAVSEIELRAGKPKQAKGDWGYADHSSDQIIAIETEFKLNKDKGVYRNTGMYRFVKSDAHPRLMTGDIDEFVFTVNQAKKFGFIFGGGSKQKIACYENETFATMQLMAEKLFIDTDKYKELQASIIAVVRVSCGKSPLPHDNNLLNTDPKKINEILKLREKWALEKDSKSAKK